MHAAAHEFTSQALVPAPWLHREPREKFFALNPAITRFRERTLMAYRVDSGYRRSTRRRIAVCELDGDLRPLPGSVVPFSDTIRRGGDLHYDPRFLVFAGRLFIHYNNNYQTRPNQIHMVEVDPASLQPLAPARPLQVSGPRREIEKNWMLFEHEGELFAVYQVSPHTILHAEFEEDGPIAFKRRHETDWDVTAYAGTYGVPCGGSPPIRHGEAYYSFFHSRIQVGAGRRLLKYWPGDWMSRRSRYPQALLRRLYWLLDRRRYYAGVYAFAAKPPFQPLWIAQEPVLRPELECKPERRSGNPCAERVVYPAGAIAYAERSWLVSYGLHDECCRLRRLEIQSPLPGGK